MYWGGGARLPGCSAQNENLNSTDYVDRISKVLRLFYTNTHTHTCIYIYIYIHIYTRIFEYLPLCVILPLAVLYNDITVRTSATRGC